MEWWQYLPPEKLQTLRSRYPTLTDAAIAAMRHPLWADEFERLGAEIVEYDPGWADPRGSIIGSAWVYPPEDFPQVSVPSDALEAFAKLVMAALLVDDVEAEAADDGLVGGAGYSRYEYMKAGELHDKNRMTVEAVKIYSELKNKRAYRIYRQLKAGAVIYDGKLKQLLPGPGYRWDPDELAKDPQRFKLIRA